MKILLAVLLCATPAVADQTHSLKGTTITIQGTARPGAVAEIVFSNREVNGADDEYSFGLEFGDVTASITFDWNADGDDDAISVEVNEGYIVTPRRLTVHESQVGTTFVYPLQSVGF